jgi:hypothetical protein
MEIAFRTRSLRELCESEEKMRKEFGLGVATTLKARLADLRAANVIADLPIGEPMVMSRPGGCALLINIGVGCRMIIQANHRSSPILSGSVDWSAVTRVKIISIERTDD